MLNHTRKTDPTVQPITLSLAKQQCRIENGVTDEDDLLSEYIQSAVRWVEEYTERSLMTQTHQVSLCEFPARLWLPRAAPLASVTFVKYYDASNVLTTVASTVYTVPAFSEPAVLTLAYAQTWPVVYAREDAVQIEYITGTSDAAAVPADLRAAILLLVGHAYMNREPIVVGTIATPLQFSIASLCAPHRISQRRPSWEAA